VAEQSKKKFNKTFQRNLLCGRLASEPELKFLPGGKAVSNFALIIEDEVGNTDYIPCVAWEGKAKLIVDNLKTGSLMQCEGKIKSSSYKDSEDRKQFKLQFELSKNGLMLFLDKRPEKPSEEEQALLNELPDIGDLK
jgi:single-stranded DNA-binding protein